MYGINVFVKVPGIDFHQLKVFDALVEPDSDYSFELDKYEFTVKGKNSKDSATLTNNTLSETVNVDASICDWGDAEENKNKFFDMAYAGIGAAAGAMLGAFKGPSSAAGQAADAASKMATLGGEQRTGVVKDETALGSKNKEIMDKDYKSAKDSTKKATEGIDKAQGDVTDNASDFADICNATAGTCATCPAASAAPGAITSVGKAANETLKKATTDAVKGVNDSVSKVNENLEGVNKTLSGSTNSVSSLSKQEIPALETQGGQVVGNS